MGSLAVPLSVTLRFSNLLFFETYRVTTLKIELLTTDLAISVFNWDRNVCLSQRRKQEALGR